MSSRERDDPEQFDDPRDQARADRAAVARLTQQSILDRAQIEKLQAQAQVDQQVVAALVEQGAVDLARITNLEQALTASRRIGAAIGIIMYTNRIDENAAFNLLRTASQKQHRKLRDIADDVLFSGRLED